MFRSYGYAFRKGGFSKSIILNEDMLKKPVGLELANDMMALIASFSVSFMECACKKTRDASIRIRAYLWAIYE